MEYHSETAREFARAWQSGLANYIKTQSEFSDALQNTYERWFRRMQATAESGPVLGLKLLAARSPSDVFAAWQEWATGLCTTTAEGYSQSISDGRKMAELEARFVPPETADA